MIVKNAPIYLFFEKDINHYSIYESPKVLKTYQVDKNFPGFESSSQRILQSQTRGQNGKPIGEHL